MENHVHTYMYSSTDTNMEAHALDKYHTCSTSRRYN